MPIFLEAIGAAVVMVVLIVGLSVLIKRKLPPAPKIERQPDSRAAAPSRRLQEDDPKRRR